MEPFRFPTNLAGAHHSLPKDLEESTNNRVAQGPAGGDSRGSARWRTNSMTTGREAPRSQAADSPRRFTGGAAPIAPASTAGGGAVDQEDRMSHIDHPGWV
jgi:hypothetical protein